MSFFLGLSVLHMGELSNACELLGFRHVFKLLLNEISHVSGSSSMTCIVVFPATCLVVLA